MFHCAELKRYIVAVVCFAVKLAVWESLLAQYIDSIEWVLEVLSLYEFSCPLQTVLVAQIV